MAEVLPALESELAGLSFVSLSTCNRVELYVDGAEAELRRVTAALERVRPGVNSQLLVADGVSALEHLTRTTCGLEAIAVGEDEVGGQVRRAYNDAIRIGRVSPALRRAFDHALRTNRDLRKIDELPHNDLMSLALEDVKSNVGSVLVIGTGQYARVVHQLLHARGVHTHWNYSTSGRRISLPFTSERVKDSTLLPTLSKVDLVVGATGAAHPVVTAEHVRILQRTGNSVPLMIDLTLNEDIAHDVSALTPVTRLGDIATAHPVSAPEQAAGYVRTQSQLLHHRMTAGVR
jgi:glutamyl-tRNA reductase